LIHFVDVEEGSNKINNSQPAHQPTSSQLLLRDSKTERRREMGVGGGQGEGETQDWPTTQEAIPGKSVTSTLEEDRGLTLSPRMGTVTKATVNCPR
jgi:hypothetical protein